MSEQVAEPADGRHHHRHANHIDDEHPLDLMKVDADAGHDFRDRDVDNRGVEGE
jgi:hypothetical protein